MAAWNRQYPPMGVPIRLNKRSPLAAGITGWYPCYGVRSLGTAVWREMSGIGLDATITSSTVTHSNGGPSIAMASSSSYAAVTHTLAAVGTEFFRVRFDSFPGSSDGQPTLFSNATIGHYFGVRGNTRLLQFYNGSWLTASHTALSTGWYDIGCAHRSGNTTLYLNGVAVLSTANNVLTGTNTFRVGGRSDAGGSAGLNGRMSEMVLWNRELSAAEMFHLSSPQGRYSLVDVADSIEFSEPLPKLGSVIDDGIIRAAA